ncbi:MAG: hypothetical protein EPN97_01965 [Alphaproteobacteria bacterium]|nr:MAG: hypothetical protein EPN97_01965 [Alphaproteobacteria bacterium]
MQTDAHDFSPEELLEKQLREAYLEHDFAQVQDLLRQKDFPNELKGSVLATALRDGNLPMVKFVIEEAKVDLTAESSIMLVFLACQAQKLDIVLYLSEKTAELGLERSDAYELVFSRFPAEKHAVAVDELLTRAGDRQDALNKMLYAAAASKTFDVIPHLLGLGADPNAQGGTVIYLLTTAYDHDFFKDRGKYLGLMKQYLEKFEDRGVLDTALTVVSFKVPDNTQYPETVRLLLDKGADPFSGHAEACRHLSEKFRQLDRADNAEVWEGVFRVAQEKDVAAYRGQFETLFKNDFRVADLLAPVTEDGDTGLMLAAKGKVLDKVVAAAVAEGTTLITAQRLLEKNARNQSLLSLALDRGDMEALFEPSYWSKADRDILRSVAQNLTEEQRPWVDLPRLSSRLDQFNLKQQAVRFKLRPST